MKRGNNNALPPNWTLYARHFTPEEVEALRTLSDECDLQPEIDLVRVTIQRLVDSLDTAGEEEAAGGMEPDEEQIGRFNLIFKGLDVLAELRETQRLLAAEGDNAGS